MSTEPPTREPQQSNPKRRKQRRELERCLTCAARKVKCDGVRDVCSRCGKIGLPCRWRNDPSSFSPATPDVLTTEAGHKRLRMIAACGPCRKRKLRCDGVQPACSACQRRNVTCIMPAKRHAGPVVNDVAGPNSPQMNVESGMAEPHAVPEEQVMRKLLDAYFQNVHPVCCNNYLHQGSLFESLARKREPQLLLLAVCGVSAKFLPDQAVAGRERMEAVRRRFLESMDNISMTSVAILQTMALHHVQEGNLVPAWNFTVLAFRMAVQLKMHQYEEPVSPLIPGHDFARRESRFRLMWSVYVLHCLLLCDEDRSNEQLLESLPLPCNVWNFMQGLPCRTLRLSEPFSASDKLTATNPCAFLIRIVIIRSNIMRFNQNLASSDQAYPWTPESTFHDLARSLDSFGVLLDANLAFGLRQLYSFRSSRQLDMLLMIHVWYYHSICQLNGLWIQDHPRASSNFFLSFAPADFAHSCTLKSITHAKQLSDLVRVVLEQDPAHIFKDVWLAISMFDSAQILITAITREAETPEKEALLSCLRVNVRVLLIMKRVFGLASKTYDACIQFARAAGLSEFGDSPGQATHTGATRPLDMIAVARRYPFLVHESAGNTGEDDMFDDGLMAYEQEEREWSDVLNGLHPGPHIGPDLYASAIDDGQYGQM